MDFKHIKSNNNLNINNSNIKLVDISKRNIFKRSNTAGFKNSTVGLFYKQFKKKQVSLVIGGKIKNEIECFVKNSCLLCIYNVKGIFCTEAFIDSNKINIHSPAVWYCMGRNTGAFLRHDCLLKLINNKHNNTIISFPEHIMVINLNVTSIELPMWYFTLSLCRSFVIMHESICALFKDILCKSLPDECRKMLRGNVKELRGNKCDIGAAQKLSVLTAINTSWDNALSSIKEIVGKQALSHKYTLTEALFILHLKPSQSCFNNLINYFKKNNYKDKNVLFYAKCITGALACVLKHDGIIPVDFEFALMKDDNNDNNNNNNDNEESYLIKDNNKELYLIKNVKKLIQAYKDNFIRE